MGRMNKKNKNNSFNKFLYLFHFFCKSLLYVAISLFAILFIFIGFYYYDLFANVKTGKYDVPLFGSYVIVSGSMIPTININDAVLVKRVDNSDLDVGDIITFSSSDSLHYGYTITHRIVGKELTKNGSYAFRTKGDNNKNEDNSLVLADNVYGRAILTIPKLGYLQNFVSKPLGLIIVILIPLMFVIIVDGYKVFNLFMKLRN